jgi:hypothetical protein
MKRLPRIILLLLAYAVGGAIINVAVAWGCARWSPVNPAAAVICGTIEPLDHARAAIMCFQSFGTDIQTAAWNYQEGSPINPANSERARVSAYFQPSRMTTIALIDTLSLHDLPAWSRERVDSWLHGLDYADYTQAGYHSEWITLYARGWPLRSFCCIRTLDTTTNLWNLSDESPAISWLDQRFVDPLCLTDQFTLPLKPLWPGFAINTTFYAAMIRGLWLLFAAPGFVRRRIRARRGQCPACAYPVGASEVCTECGRPVTPRA